MPARQEHSPPVLQGTRVRGRRDAMRLRLGVVLAAGVAAGAVTIGVVPIGSGAPIAQTATLTPVADSYVRADRPRDNFGKASSLQVSRSPVSVAYLRFRVAVPSGRTISG